MVPRAYRDGEPHKIAAVPEGPPGTVVSGQKQQRIRTVEQVGRVRPDLGPFEFDVFLARDDAQHFVQDLDLEIQVLHGGHDRLQQLGAVRRLEYTGLRGPYLDLARFRQPDLLARIPLVLVPPFVGRTALGQQRRKKDLRGDQASGHLA